MTTVFTIVFFILIYETYKENVIETNIKAQISELHQDEIDNVSINQGSGEYDYLAELKDGSIIGYSVDQGNLLFLKERIKPAKKIKSVLVSAKDKHRLGANNRDHYYMCYFRIIIFDIVFLIFCFF